MNRPGQDRRRKEAKIIFGSIRERLFPPLSILKFLLALSLAGTPSRANREPIIQSDAPVKEVSVDEVHEYVSEQVEDGTEFLDHHLDTLLAPERDERSRTFDRFFGDRRLEVDDDEENYISIGPQLQYEDGEVEFDVDFSTRLNLPKTENRLQLIVDNMEDDNQPLQGFSQSELQQSPGDRNSTNAFIRFRVFDAMRTSLDLDVGLKFKPEPVTKFKVRGRIRWEDDSWRFRISQYGYWESDDGFGEKTTFDFLWRFDEDFFAQSDSAAYFGEDSEGLELGQTFSLFYRISERRTIRSKLGIYAQTRPSTRVERYLYRLPYRQKIFKEWIYLNVEPGFDLYREHNFSFDPRLTIQLEFLFGDWE